MKHVVSVSLGSSARNKSAEQEFLGERILIERIGTDGSIEKAIKMIQDLDGKVDAFGMGGIDLWIGCGRKKYMLKDAIPIARAAKKTPIVDGSGLKGTLERRVVRYLNDVVKVPFKDLKVLVVSAMDRFGMAEAFQETGCDLILGDFIFVLDIPIKLHSLAVLDAVGRIIAPFAVRMPFSKLYPTGEQQYKTKPNEKHAKFYYEADVIAGDFLYVMKNMPPRLPGKTILTNTVTERDVEDLRARGVSTLITTTPNIEGRSFGTNVMEAVIVALLGKDPDKITVGDYEDILDRVGFKPRIEVLNPPSIIPSAAV